MSDDAPASPAAVLRTLVARAVDADPAGLDDRVEVVERGAGPKGGSGGGRDARTPVERLAALIAEADGVVAVVPRFDAALARRLNESLAAVPHEVRVVFTDAAGDRLAGATGPIVRRALAERGVDAYRHGGESPVAVVLADDRAAVGLIDGDGVAALLTTDDPAVREWAAATCRRYLDAAEPVTEG